MKKKQTQSNSVAFAAPPETQDTQDLRTAAHQGADYSTPIRNAYARAEQNLNRSYQNPLGAYTTADVRDKSLRSEHADLQQNMGMDLASAAQQNAEGQFGRQATLAGMTQPRMYQSGSVGTQSDPFGQAMQLGQMISGVASAGLS